MKAARTGIRQGIAFALTILMALTSATSHAQGGTLRERWAARQKQGADMPALQEFALQLGAHQRHYLLQIPRSLKPGHPAPLILALHGGGGHAAFMADDARYGLRTLAEREGVVLAFPNGYSRLPGGKLATWNAGLCCGDARDRQIDDVAFIRAVVADIRTRIAIDPDRIFATGMSNGGMLAHRLACDASDIFTAVASVAGTDATQHCKPSRAVSVLHIHARDDTHVLFEGGAGAEAFRDRSKVMDFVSVAETIARSVDRHHCTRPPRVVLVRDGAQCERYEPCAEKARVQLCVTDSGGHSWPGADVVRRGKQPASQALDANEVLWDFFSRTASR